MDTFLPPVIYYFVVGIVALIVFVGIPYIIFTTVSQYSFSYSQNKWVKYTINGGITLAYFLIMFVFIYDNMMIFKN